MALPEAWPVAASRGDFTAAAGWFCFSFDCFSLDCATATSDKHANPNTRILLFIFSLLCAGNGRHWLSRSERQTSYPHSDSDVGRLRRAPQVTEVLAGRVARAPSPAKIPSMQPRASSLVHCWNGPLQSLPRAEPNRSKPPPSCHPEAASAPRNLLFPGNQILF